MNYLNLKLKEYYSNSFKFSIYKFLYKAVSVKSDLFQTEILLSDYMY